jgi:hypothetical protein
MSVFILTVTNDINELSTTDEDYQIYVNNGDIIIGVQHYYGTTAARALKKIALVAISAEPGAYTFFDEEENTNYDWNGSDWV